MLINSLGLLLLVYKCRPSIFRSAGLGDCNGDSHSSAALQEDNELNTSDDDGLPPLEANVNRMRPAELQSDTESDSDASS